MDRAIYDRMRELEQSHWWFTARREILTEVIAGLRLPPKADILELGAGTGGNLGMLSGFGHVRAIEPDDASRRYAMERTGMPIDRGLLPDRLPEFDTNFDLVCAFDVVEHVADDAGALAAMRRLMKPGGRLVTTVPAYQWMWSPHDEQHHHKRRYTLPAYRALFPTAGLTVTRATYFNTLLFPPIAGVRLARILTGAKGADDEAQPSAPINRLFHRIFASEAALLRHADLPFGVSILVVAERPR